MSITDIEDKIIQKSAKEKCHFTQITNHYTTQFIKDMGDLKVIVFLLLCINWILKGFFAE